MKSKFSGGWWNCASGILGFTCKTFIYIYQLFCNLRSKYLINSFKQRRISMEFRKQEDSLLLLLSRKVLLITTFIMRTRFDCQLEHCASFPRFLSLVGICCCSVAKLCPTLCNSMDCSPPGSSVLEISQARTLEWAFCSFLLHWWPLF